MPLTCLPKARYRITAKTMKLSEATMIQKKLIARPPPVPPSWAATMPAAAAGPTTENRFIDVRPASFRLASRGRLEDDGQDRDDDRKDAEAFRERRAKDELGADLRRGIRVPPDRGRREAGQDADADAGADDAEGREAGSDELHSGLPPSRAAGASRGRLVSAWLAGRPAGGRAPSGRPRACWRAPARCCLRGRRQTRGPRAPHRRGFRPR